MEPNAISADAQASRLFIHAAFITAICLQRFGLILGDSAIFLSLPAFAAMIFWAYLSGYGELRPRVGLLYVTFAAWGLFCTLVALLIPDARFGVSLTSLMAILISYTLLTIGPSRRFDRSQVLPAFLFYARLCAVLGIIQYLAQFVGVKLFSFMVSFPFLEPVLVERMFNYAPIVSYGSTLMRSNGFFLVEPSIFSQLLALAIAIDFFLFRRKLYLPLYGIAYLLTNSGTGFLVLSVGMVVYAMIDWRYLGRVTGAIVAGAALAFAASYVMPDQIDAFAGRADEVNSNRSSGYSRYFAQFDLIGRYGSEMRGLIGWGPGALERADGFVPGSSNPSLKLYFDYGLIGLGLFWTFLISAIWRREMALIPVLAIVQFQLGGGSLLFTPLLVLMAMLCIWSKKPQTAL
ncbi:hypothetical protein [Sphingobium boeckii]|uniref:O-antigen ligase domain-containing protein n=1 Tax=Sphingobium boeckii TaxID=1082345 RepID=A0A7W9EFJ3_9SPHN|nr:hypothetical protein [Sphingobium boeckii]MBB5685761.1 hypothetical protein [Sphingobium boeckii]